MNGSRGPLPKPTALKVLEGNPGKRALDLTGGINPRIEVPPAPRHLGKEARKEWARITPLLFELGLISGLDRAALANYCQTYGRLVELELAFAGQVSRLQEERKLDYSDAVFEVSSSTTPSGYQQQSVIVQVITRHREMVHRYLMHFGLSPAARGRVQASNYVQPELPGISPPGEQPPAASGFARFAEQRSVH